MKREIAEIIVDAGSEIDVELSLYENYSGRNMFGKTTCGLRVAYMADLVAAAAYAAAYHACADDSGCETTCEDIVTELKHLKTDNLGRQLIVY